MRNLLIKRGIGLLVPRFQSSLNLAKYSNLASTCEKTSRSIIPGSCGSRVCFSLSSSVFKDKNRGKEKKAKKGSETVNIDESVISELVDVEKLKLQMEKNIENLKNELVKNVSLRSTAGSIEDLPIKMDGKDYVVQDLAQIARKPKMIILNVDSFPQAAPFIAKALSESGMGLNPQQEGHKIIIQIPKVTKELRETLSKNAKQLFEKCKVNLRNVQNYHIKKVSDDPNIPQDLSRQVQAQIRAINEKYTHEAEKILATKQRELLGNE